MKYPNSGRIAAYSVILGRVFYWDKETNDFTLMEVEPGVLVRVEQFPQWRRKRAHSYSRDGKFAATSKQQ